MFTKNDQGNLARKTFPHLLPGEPPEITSCRREVLRKYNPLLFRGPITDTAPEEAVVSAPQPEMEAV
ncbi:hypothetical protein [Acetobacter persici]|uniref:Uncharacterized protein n=1 Tax=Acetobacter persici TaxID=1076596 RepID=A0A1U9LIW3_9PROT|nr:hypothetical protein [Acetobacter persici]AQT06299.1 hypothetical protein A0U91_14835 [Acetobacter persici]